MSKKQLIVTWVIIICLCPLIANAVTFDDMVMHRSSDKQPFWGYTYKNIKWVSHIPDPETTPSFENEAGSGGQIDIGRVDIDSNGKPETIKVIWSHGVSEHLLEIEMYKDEGMKQLIAHLEPTGAQANFKVEDLDGNNKLEIIIWGAVADPNMSQDISDESKPFEGHSDPHLFKVDAYKLDKDKYVLQGSYVSKQKYEPFCEEQPK